MSARLVLPLALLLAACGAGEAADSTDPDETTLPTPVPTVAGVGLVPDTVPVEALMAPPVSVTRPVDDEGAVLELVADRVDGNRLLVVGDSIMAGTARRFGGELCDVLVPDGWAVQIEAEPGRFVGFGTRVLDALLPDDGAEPEDDWDAVIVHLGSNYRGDELAYEDELTDILSRLAPRPTLLYTVTEYRPEWAEVNEVVRRLGAALDHVTVLDWERLARTPGVLSGDGLHPTGQGELALVELTSLALGGFPGVEGECLRSQFTDDSAIGVGRGPTGSSRSSGSSSGSTRGGSSSRGSTSSGSGGSTGGANGGTEDPSTGDGGDVTDGDGSSTGDGGDVTGGDGSSTGDGGDVVTGDGGSSSGDGGDGSSTGDGGSSSGDGSSTGDGGSSSGDGSSTGDGGTGGGSSTGDGGTGGGGSSTGDGGSSSGGGSTSPPAPAPTSPPATSPSTTAGG